MTAASSGPRSCPVSASRSAFRSPPTAFSSRRIARGSRSRLDELPEARERLGRVDVSVRGLEHELGVRARLGEIPRAAQHRRHRDRHADAGGELLVAQRRERLGGEAPHSGEVEVDVVPRQSQLLEVGANGLGGNAFLAQ